MKIDIHKLNIAMAKACVSNTDLRKHFSSITVTKLCNDPDYNPRPIIVGKLAKAIGCEVTDIVED